MEKQVDYEVRFRGEFMCQGTHVFELNHKRAMQTAGIIRKQMGNFKETDCIVIEQGPGPNNGDWHLISKNGYSQNLLVKLDEKIIHPNDRDSQKRLTLAKACETACQKYDANPNLEFANFDDQLKKYQEIFKTEEEEKEFLMSPQGYWRRMYAKIIKDDARINEEKKQRNNRLREDYKNDAVEKAAECLKECALAETAIINWDQTIHDKAMSSAHNCWIEATMLERQSNAWAAMSNANHRCEEAGHIAGRIHVAGATKPNEAEIAVANAEKQLKITHGKYIEFRKERELLIKTKRIEKINDTEKKQIRQQLEKTLGIDIN